MEKVKSANTELHAYSKSISNYQFTIKILAFCLIVSLVGGIGTILYLLNTHYVLTAKGQAEIERMFDGDFVFAEEQATEAVSKWATLQLTFDKGSYEDGLKHSKYFASEGVHEKFKSLYYDQKDDGSKPYFTEWIENDISVSIKEVSNKAIIQEDGSVEVRMNFVQRYQRNSNKNVFKDYSLSVRFLCIPINQSKLNRTGYLISEDLGFQMSEI